LTVRRQFDWIERTDSATRLFAHKLVIEDVDDSVAALKTNLKWRARFVVRPETAAEVSMTMKADESCESSLETQLMRKSQSKALEQPPFLSSLTILFRLIAIVSTTAKLN
jgi:hypothetical protein